MASDLSAPVETAALAAEVEGLLDSAEPEGIYRDTRECGAGLLLLGALLISPPTPRPPKTDAR
ncbi:hypothetical protein SAMN05216223_110166 [Actinacidiphila yanglinensis]|uniref:Uncharacterized protein n=1 Tax=Actinacidiphila yanglinensis TaxID=310779 RepID=A0A1H6CVR4_9ACTN|nr:hypothetical protein [Actinacidiphila yanglinensis]SEG77054.1 hypothetical protein SAMN05216223_110166 [Actinacidiphila yanglinensis]